jgi:two-component system sensor histidine kinase TorS
VRVLIVEDDRVTRLVASEFLDWLGAAHETGGDVREALDLLRRQPPDIVLMDISMPDLDGFEALRRIRALPAGRALPVLAMSAHVFQSEIESYLAAGFDGFVPKPLDVPRLGQAIAAALGRLIPEPGAADIEGLRSDIAALGAQTVSRLQAVARSVVPPRLDEISVALRSGDRARVRELAHALRSAAGSASLPALLKAASALEERADHAPLEYLYGRLDDCRSGFESGMAVWDRELATQDSPANR